MYKHLYRIERLTKDNFIDFHALFEQVFKAIPLHELKRKYETQHIIDDYWVFLAYAKETGKIAASYGVIPWLFQYKEESILAAQSGDTMTAEKHRGKGLFGLLHEYTVDCLTKNGFNFIFGFPNQNSFPVFKNKLNWQFFGHLTFFSIKTACIIPTRKIVSKVPVLSKLHNARVNAHFSKYTLDKMPDFDAMNYEFCSLKNQNFYHYKLTAQHKILLVGNTIMVVKITNRITIGECIAPNYATLKADFNQLLLLAKKLGFSEIDFLGKNLEWHNLLFETVNGTQSLPVGVLPLSKYDLNFEILSLSTIDLDTF